MIRLVLAALRSHRAQAGAVGLLAALAAAAAALTPPYLVGAVREGTVFAVESAPVSMRVVSATREVQPTDPEGVLRRVGDEVRAAIERPGLALVASLRAEGRLVLSPEPTAADAGIDAELVYRDGMCARLAVVGVCPGGAGELLVSAEFAATFGFAVGAAIAYAPGREPPRRARIAGLYRVADPADPYWGDGQLLGLEPVFVSLPALRAFALPSMTAVLEGVVTPALFREIEPTASANAVNNALFDLENSGYSVRSSLGVLGDRVVMDRRFIGAGVPVAGVQLLLLCWFTLALAVRHAAAGRRPDVGLLKLRGVGPGRIAVLAVGRSGLPVLFGAVVGGAFAALVGPALATGPPGSPALAVPGHLVVAAGVGAAVLTVLGSIAVAAWAERGMLREPVVDLLRRVPERRGGWRGGVLEMVVVALAAAAVYQIRAVPAGDARFAGLALFGPVLVALAAALVGTRLLVPLATALARRALAAASLAAALAVLDLARRPGARRLAALLGVATALLITATTGWDSAATARAERAGLELGADRVVTVVANNNAHLLAAVRAADPGGRAAMAAVEGRVGTNPDAPPGLAVDSSRLAAVAAWPARAGSAPRDLAAALHPPTHRAIRLAGRGVELEVTAPVQAADPAGSPAVVALLVDHRGVLLAVTLGPVQPGRHTVRAAAPSCATATGCRLVSLTLTYPATGVFPPEAEQVVLHRLAQADPAAEVLGPDAFGDLARWRLPLSAQRPQLVFGRAADGLGLRAVPLPELRPERIRQPEPLTIEVADAPLPLPAVAAGGLAERRRAGERALNLLGDLRIPVRVEPSAGPLPRVLTRGLLVDLDYADRLAAGASGTRQVWLARGAPAGILDRLRAEGLEVASVVALSGRTERYAGQGTAAVLRFQLAVAVAGLVLAAGAVVLVAIVDRPARAAELAALRRQGVPAVVAARSVAGGYAALVAIAVGLGVLAAVLARWFAGPGLPPFDDGWAVLPRPAPDPLSLAVLALAAGAVLAVAVVAATLPLRRLVREAR
jgi:hypothetical protein